MLSGVPALLLLALAITCLSQPANLIRLANAPIAVIGFWRLLVAAAALTPSAWRSRRSWISLGPGDRALTLLAGLLFFVHLWTFVYAAQHTGVARCMVAFSTHPLWTGAGAWLFFGEAVTARLLGAYALAAAGIWLLLGGAASGAESFTGDLAALASALLFSGYVLSGRRLRRRLDNAVYAGSVYGVAALCFLAAGWHLGVVWTGYPPMTWAAILGLALGVTLGGHALFTYLLSSMNINLLSCAKLLEPVGAAFGAWLLFGEPLHARAVAAFACIAAGVLLLLAGSAAKDSAVA